MKRIFGGFAAYFWVLVALLPVMILRDFTPDNELRYLSIADEALREGNWLAFTNHGAAYADKPPLYIWIVMLGKTIFGYHCMWFLSFFSLIPAFVIAEVMGRWAAPDLGREFNTEAKLLLLSCGLFTATAVVLRMDMLMTMWIVIALWAFYKMYHERERRCGTPMIKARWRWFFPVWIFLGVFTKGPMGILIPLVSIFVFLGLKRRLGYMGLAWGWRTWLVLAVLCALWFGGVYLEGGYEYLDNLLVHQTVDRAVSAFHHQRPFWYYLAAIWYCFLPWVFLIIGMVVVGLARRQHWLTDRLRLFLATGLSTIVLLSCISSKIQIYMLPAYPFFVYYAAAYAWHYRGSRLAALSITLPAVVLCVAGVSLWFISGMEGMEMLRHPLVYVAGGALAVCCAIGILFMWRGRDIGYGVRWISLGLFLMIFTAGFAVPDYNKYMGYGEMSEQAVSLREKTGAKGYYVYKVRRPENMDVYIGERPRELPEDAVAPYDSLPPGRWIVMTPVGEKSKFKYRYIKECGPYAVIATEGAEKTPEMR